MQNQLRTRKPTGQPGWPMVLLAGVEGGGKSWAAVEGTALPIIDRAFYLEIGECMADEYGAVPGADFEIIEHDGSYPDMLHQARLAARQPAAEGKVNMLIVDSISVLWELLKDEMQYIANQSNRRAKKDGNKPITLDLWAIAKERYEDFMQVLREFNGPVILTARLDQVAVVEGNTPTGEKIWKPAGHKNLAYQVQVVVQARRPREWTLTKIASSRFQLQKGGEMPLPDFTLGALFDAMGLDAASPNLDYVRPSPAGVPALPADPEQVIGHLEKMGDRDGLTELWKVANAHGNSALTDLIAAAGRRVTERQKASQQAGEAQRPTPADSPPPQSMSDAVAQTAAHLDGHVVEGELMPMG